MFSLSIFPFIGSPLLQKILNQNETEYNQLLDERKKHVVSFIINAIKK